MIHRRALLASAVVGCLVAATLAGAAPGVAAALTTTRVSVGPRGVQGDGFSDVPAVSRDGRFIAFSSYATDLVAGDHNGTGDVFVRDRQAGTTVRVSVSSTGGESDGFSGGHPSISADGRYVAFSSIADNLVAGDTNRVEDVSGTTY